MFRDVAQAGVMGVCVAPNEMNGRIYTRDFVGGERNDLRGVTLYGGAMVDADLGLQLDGVDSYAELGTWLARYGRSSFTMSFWFTKADCSTFAGTQTQYLFSHTQDPDGLSAGRTTGVHC